LIEDSPTSTELVKIWLEEGLHVPYSLQTSVTLAGGLEILAENQTDIVVVDLNLPDSEGRDTFKRVLSAAEQTPVVIMSSESDESLAIEAVRLGAQDYVVKKKYGDENLLTRPILYAIERNARHHAEQELHQAREQVELARKVQQKLFPNNNVYIPGIDVAGRCIPADLTGGDYFDFIPMLGDKRGIVIGDVCGHGLASALFMVSVRAVMRAFAVTYDDPGFILGQTNRLLVDDLIDGRFVTMLFACLNPATKDLRFASAGHPGFIFDVEGNLRVTLESDSPPIGAIDDQQFQTVGDARLEPGETLLLFTDGINECLNERGEMFGQDRLFELIRGNRQKSAQEIVEGVFDTLRAFSGGLTQEDDMTVVVIKSCQ
jgi:serine phosphatase RsbU (regulator of sigma subunit)